VPKAKRSPSSPSQQAKPESDLGDRRRLDLLEAAYALIAEKGLEGLRTRDVAARAKVNISTLHYYFGTKEALLAALVEWVCAKFDTHTTWDEAAREDPLHAHFSESWRVFHETPNLATVLDELSTRSRREPDTRAAFCKVYRRWNSVVEQLLRGLIAGGRLRDDADAAAGAFVVTSFIIGASIQLGINDQAFDYTTVARELERWITRSPGRRRT
jgi:AcrR family transcriptional regulator